MMKNLIRHGLSFVLLFCMGSLFAQITTSGLSGRVYSGAEPLTGATVLAIHEPSGTRYATISNSAGLFDIQGMRSGGPYRVEFSFIGYNKEVHTEVNLSLGETYQINADLNEGVDMEEVVVTASASAFNAEKTGASTSISGSQMKSMPTINRSVSDMARMSPYATGMSIAGGDGRSTNFTLDGANFNNNFGLSSSLPGGGNPISLDAIEEIQVVVTPYDVRQTNFIGGGINAITKSGTNTFKGTAYAYYTDESMRGNKFGDYDFGERPDYSRTIIGATLGGPIVKDKLFFFASAETVKEPGQVVNWRASENGISDGATTSRASVGDMQKVSDHLKTKYGYNTGSFTDFPGDESNIKLLARIDWNINDNHKFNFRYNYTKNQGWNPTNGNSNNAGTRNRDMDRISQYSMAFSNSIYSIDNIINSLSTELNSKFSDKLHNKLIVTYTDVEDMRGSNSSPFPFIDIMHEDAYNAGNDEPYISAGYELFTWNNGVNNEVFNITDNVTYYADKHKFTAGASYEYQMANNAYMRNGTGYYRYKSLDDFLNDATPVDFALTYGYGGEKNPAAEVAFNQIGAYVQDEFNVNDNLKLTVGVRADYLWYKDDLIRNNAIYDLDFGGRKIDTGMWPDGNVLWSPRVGFTWDVRGDKTFKVRGGTGIFTGRLPLVFFTNMPTSSGMVQGSFQANTTYDNGDTRYPNQEGSNWAALSEVFGNGMITDVDDMIDKLANAGYIKKDITPEDGALPGDISAIDPDFKMPQVWKSSLAVDYTLPTSFPFTATVEGIYTKTINGVMLKNWDLEEIDDSWERFQGSDNRYIYPSDISHTGTDAFVLSNTSEGWGAIGNITLNAMPVKNLNLMAAYTHTMNKEVSGMPGSSAFSAYNGIVSVNGPHASELQRSQYMVPDKLIASASYRLQYAGNKLATTFSLFYSGFSPEGFSYTYANDMNGNGFSNDLIYIPSQKGEIKFVSSADEDAFFKFVEQDKYLSKHKGEYAEAYAAQAPWVHNFDLRILQDFNLNVANRTHTLQLSIDVLNIGNLLNSEWGTYKNHTSANNGNVLRYEGLDQQNNPTFSMPMIEDTDGNDVYPTESFANNYDFRQLWSLQVGLRYIF
ncbi:TonB-dependent receptor [Saccharicrinis aurantiacus]|uniref:TonB-dependent receptor n=1 Tax=Saccharicrinis aurantiacus TaxID=1849719 RepID=UPI00248F83ED|nr:TonB-dependent receptor [Saccharicrinis aurantiacus]